MENKKQTVSVPQVNEGTKFDDKGRPVRDGAERAEIEKLKSEFLKLLESKSDKTVGYVSWGFSSQHGLSREADGFCWTGISDLSPSKDEPVSQGFLRDPNLNNCGSKSWRVRERDIVRSRINGSSSGFNFNFPTKNQPNNEGVMVAYYDYERDEDSLGTTARYYILGAEVEEGEFEKFIDFLKENNCNVIKPSLAAKDFEVIETLKKDRKNEIDKYLKEYSDPFE